MSINTSDIETYHILLADDDESDRFLFLEACEGLHIKTQVHTVKDGPELMSYLNLVGNTSPHFLFLDLHMPRKNGIQCLQEIRSCKKFDDMFIAIYSDSTHENDMEETFLNDANRYIVKPGEFSKLKQVLNKAITSAMQYLDLPFDKTKYLLTA